MNQWFSVLRWVSDGDTLSESLNKSVSEQTGKWVGELVVHKVRDTVQWTNEQDSEWMNQSMNHWICYTEWVIVMQVNHNMNQSSERATE